MNNVYAFIQNPKPFLEVCGSSTAYKIMERLNNGEKIQESDYIIFREINSVEAYKNGIYRIMGYIFDFRKYFKKYLVKTKYYGWQEQYAPSKMFIRKNSSSPSHIIKIIELK